MWTLASHLPSLDSDEILACHKAGITVTLPKPMTSNAKAEGRFGKQDFRYVAEEDVYVCPAGKKLSYHYTNEENGLVLRRYWTNACQSCAIKQRCTTGKERLRATRKLSVPRTEVTAGMRHEQCALSFLQIHRRIRWRRRPWRFSRPTVAAREHRRLANAPAVIRSADDDDAIVGRRDGGW